jgi:hypothetical protein
MQEAITLVVFGAFSVPYLKEPLKWNYLAGFGLVVAAVFVIFHDWGGPTRAARTGVCTDVGSTGDNRRENSGATGTGRVTIPGAALPAADLSAGAPHG